MPTDALDPAKVHPELAALAHSFERRVERVGDRVLVAIGYGLANTVMIVGDEGVIVVDVMESVEAAAEARDALRAHCDLPVRALVYTHGHPDHVWGGRAWVPEGAEAGVEIIAHASVPQYVNEFANVLDPRYTLGGLHMYGGLLPEGPDGFVVNGIGPRLRAGAERGYVPPTRTFEDELDVELAGVRLHLRFGPGESPDEIFVWLPDDGVLLSADTVYRSFPNLTTIRGARFRDPRDWYRTIDAMRTLGAEHLVPCHGGPLSGRQEVMDVLTAYRDAIQYLFDQSVRGMNAGLTPDELAQQVVLPPHLAEHPWLQPWYGTVGYCARHVHAGLYGWFSGDGADLEPPPRAEESAEIVALAGGTGPALEALRVAVDEGRLAWATRLAGHLLRVDPDLAEARALQATVLRRRAAATRNANNRNWWLTEAAILEGAFPDPRTFIAKVARRRAAGLLDEVPAALTVEALTHRLDPAAAATLERTVVLAVPDDDLEAVLAVRRGVCALETVRPAQVDLRVTLSRRTLVALVVGSLTWEAGLADGSVELVGDAGELLATMACFDDWRPA